MPHIFPVLGRIVDKYALKPTVPMTFTNPPSTGKNSNSLIFPVLESSDEMLQNVQFSLNLIILSSTGNNSATNVSSTGKNGDCRKKL